MGLRRFIGVLRRDNLTLEDWKTRDLERELSRRIDISDEHEKRILELWAIEDQKIQSEKKAKKREQRAIQDRINLLERAMSLDREYQSLLLQQIEIMQKQMQTRSQIQTLTETNIGIQRKGVIFWEVIRFCRAPGRKMKEWRGSLRRIRSMKDLGKAMPQPPLVRSLECQDLTNGQYLTS